jgi:flagellar assembly protein FliH
VRLAVAIARRIVRRELHSHPEIAVEWIREALALAVGSGRIQLYLHPQDHAALGDEVRELVAGLGQLGETEIVADSQISPGGCRVVTQFGEVDQRLETQLARIEEELT